MKTEKFYHQIIAIHARGSQHLASSSMSIERLIPFFSSILRTISHMPKTETWKFERVKAQSLHGEGYHVVNPENCDLKDMRFTFGDNKVNLPNPLIYHLFG